MCRSAYVQGENPTATRKKKTLGVGVGVGAGVLESSNKGPPDATSGDFAMGQPEGTIQSDHPHSHPHSHHHHSHKSSPHMTKTDATSLRNNKSNKDKASPTAGGGGGGGGSLGGMKPWFSTRGLLRHSSKINRDGGGDGESDEEGGVGDDDNLASKLEQGLVTAQGQGLDPDAASDHHYHHHNHKGYIYHDFLTPREELGE